MITTSAGSGGLLLQNEAEVLVQSLDASTLERFGDKQWWTRHEIVEKLNMQAIYNVSSNNDEFVKDLLISFNKIHLLVTELITSELWTEKVFPIVKDKIKPAASTLPVYMGLFHEASVMSLLETSLFYQEFCEAADDDIIDVVDYLNRKILKLVLDKKDERVSKKDNDDYSDTVADSGEELVKQHSTIEFNICMKALSVLRYISDSIDQIPLSAVTRMLDTHDFPCLLVQVLDKHPWKRTDTDSGNMQLFDDNKWASVKPLERNLLTKLEGQVWLTLYQLLMHPEAQRKYEYTSYRKSQILNLRKYFNEIFFDQLPHMRDLQLYIEHLSITEMSGPSAPQNLVIEQVPEVREQLLRKYKGRYENIAKKQLEDFFSMSGEAMKEAADRLAATYDLDVLESLLDEPPVCANCHGGDAVKRCSRCHNEWYCSRPCQVQHWAKHKPVCNMLVQAKRNESSVTSVT